MHGYGMLEHMNMMGPQMWFFMILLWGFAIFGLACAIRWIYVHTQHDRSRQ